MKKVVKYELLTLIIWWGTFIAINEVNARIFYEDRLSFLGLIPTIIFPIVVIILYFKFKDKLKENISKCPNIKISLIWLLLIVITTVLVLSLGGNYIGYCNPDLEKASGNWFDARCFLSGIEYYLMPFIYFIPIVVIGIYNFIIIIKGENDMKNKKLVLGIVSVVVIIIIGIIIYIYIDDNKLDYNSDYKNIYLGNYTEEVVKDDNYVFKDKEELKNKFSNVNVNDYNFKKYNYILITIRYNPCADKNIKIKDYEISGNVLNVDVEYSSNCDLCDLEIKYYLIPISKDIDDLEVNMDYIKTNDIVCDYPTEDKPMIYLYPTEKMDVKVELGYKDKLITSYPKYNDSWEVIANPNGILIDKNNNRSYYGLYWEGNNHYNKILDDGFVIKGSDTADFLEEKLNLLGLNEFEANEFIVYWLPKLEQNKYNYIRFETIEEINDYMPLNITPTPDTIIRISMDYKPLDEPIEVIEQQIITPKRYGFTVVEWGGSLIK